MDVITTTIDGLVIIDYLILMLQDINSHIIV